jgi:hypothetical protein
MSEIRGADGLEELSLGPPWASSNPLLRVP